MSAFFHHIVANMIDGLAITGSALIALSFLRLARNTHDRRAVAILTGETARGTVTFEEHSGRLVVQVDAQIDGSSMQKHGFHVHEFGDAREECKGMGSHFRLSKRHDHGKHAGDLGNVETDAKGRVSKTIETNLSLDPRSKRCILGRGIVLHEKEDDLGMGMDDESLKTGNAGRRIACGVVARAS